MRPSPVGDGATCAAAAGRRPPGAGAEGGAGSLADRPEAGVTDDAGLETNSRRAPESAHGPRRAPARARGSWPRGRAGARRSGGPYALRTSETAMSREILVRYLHTYSTGVTRPSALKPRPLTL